MVAFIVALGCALLLTPVAIAVLRRIKVYDQPNHRSSHTVVVVRGAGWSVLISVLIGWTAAGAAWSVTWWMPAAACLLGLVGFADDMRTLPVVMRLAPQLVVALGAMVAADGSGAVEMSVLAIVIGAGFVVAYVNAFNFMDGINGISGMQGVAVGLVLWLASPDGTAVSYGALALAGASLGFLPYNAVKAKCFLGDVGSYFMGAWIALLCVYSLGEGVHPLVVLGAVAIYAADTGTTLVRRVVRGEKWWASHREHGYQNMVDHGRSQHSVASGLALLTLSTGLLGYAAQQRPTVWVGCVVGTASGAIVVAYLLAAAMDLPRPRVPSE